MQSLFIIILFLRLWQGRAQNVPMERKQQLYTIGYLQNVPMGHDGAIVRRLGSSRFFKMFNDNYNAFMFRRNIL